MRVWSSSLVGVPIDLSVNSKNKVNCCVSTDD